MRIEQSKQKQPKTKEYFIELIQHLIDDNLNETKIHFYMYCDEYKQLEKIWNDVPEFVDSEYILEADEYRVLLSSPPQLKVYLRKGK